MIKLDETLIGFDGKEIPGRAGTGLKVGGAISDALLAPQNDDTEKKKLDKYFLAKKINEAGKEVKLSSPEKILIQTSAGKIYAPLVLGRLHDILEK